MVDQPLTDVRHGLEATVRMLRKARHDAAVIHAPSIGTGEVHTDIPCLKRGLRTHVLIRNRVAVEMVDAEKERVRGPPLSVEGEGLENRI
jgi:hypothetical protein